MVLAIVAQVIVESLVIVNLAPMTVLDMVNANQTGIVFAIKGLFVMIAEHGNVPSTLTLMAILHCALATVFVMKMLCAFVIPGGLDLTAQKHSAPKIVQVEVFVTVACATALLATTAKIALHTHV